MKKILLLAVVFILFFPLGIIAENEKPFVIPELKEWKGKKGYLKPSENFRIVCPSSDTELTRIAGIFADDYLTMFGYRPDVVHGKAKTGDIVFRTAKDQKLGKEGYRIHIADRITVTAPYAKGVYWGTRTLLQLSEQTSDRSLPKGEITDFPDYELRGFLLDCGRKFFPLHFLEDYVKFMSYYKMNVFHIHLNDNGFKQFFQNDWSKTYAAFRLECETYPGLTAQDGYYTKEEFIGLQQLAEKHFVEIVPEIDIPAHSLAFAHYKDELGSEEYGKDHLDLFNPETYRFFDALLKEYLGGENPVFRGPKVHIGTDEYSNKKKEVVEKFRYFTDHYIREVEKYGKQACVWGALTHARGNTPVKSEDVLMWLWHNPFAQPDSMMNLGYRLISIPDGLLYIVPNAGYYHDYLNIKRIYETWTPARIGNKKFAEKDPRIPGGMFAVWNDHVGNGISTKDVHHRALPAMQTLAVKMWTGQQAQLSFEAFDKKRTLLSEAPGVNIAGRIGLEPGEVFSKSNLSPGDRTGYTEIGYDYTISFDLDGRSEEKGTILFSSPDTEFYLSDPISGMLGFARDGYLNTFNYRVKEGEKVNIRISGNNKETYLYLNGQLKETLNNRKMFFEDPKSTMNYIRTLVFPLEKAGNFNSRISDFKVYNYIR